MHCSSPGFGTLLLFSICCHDCVIWVWVWVTCFHTTLHYLPRASKSLQQCLRNLTGGLVRRTSVTQKLPFFKSLLPLESENKFSYSQEDLPWEGLAASVICQSTVNLYSFLPLQNKLPKRNVISRLLAQMNPHSLRLRHFVWKYRKYFSASAINLKQSQMAHYITYAFLSQQTQRNAFCRII